jgi:hypothetical protein
MIDDQHITLPQFMACPHRSGRLRRAAAPSPHHRRTDDLTDPTHASPAERIADMGDQPAAQDRKNNPPLKDFARVAARTYARKPRLNAKEIAKRLYHRM